MRSLLTAWRFTAAAPRSSRWDLDTATGTSESVCGLVARTKPGSGLRFQRGKEILTGSRNPYAAACIPGAGWKSKSERPVFPRSRTLRRKHSVHRVHRGATATGRGAKISGGFRVIGVSVHPSASVDSVHQRQSRWDYDFDEYGGESICLRRNGPGALVGATPRGLTRRVGTQRAERGAVRQTGRGEIFPHLPLGCSGVLEHSKAHLNEIKRTEKDLSALVKDEPEWASKV